MKKAFTLIELVVGITISMILMVSVGIFVSSGMQNIFLQQRVLQSTSDFTDFANNLHTSFNLIQSGSFEPVNTASGIIFKRGQSYGDGGFSYIGTETLSGVYCENEGTDSSLWPEDTETNSAFLKSFIPFEEENENIFNDYEKILTASGGTNYTSYQKEHIIKDSSGNIVIGKGVFGDKFEEGTFGTGIYLNSPTGLAWNNPYLFISDTLNNRVLYYDTTDLSIHKLLDELDGLNEPTGLYYNDTDKALYIANSGNGEILKYSSKKTITTNPNLNLSFSGTDITNINKFSLEFLTGTINLIGPTSIGSFSFTNINNNTDYMTGSTNKLEYYFADYASFNSVLDTDCTTSGDFNYYTLVSNSPVHKTMTDCNTNTGTLITYSGNIATDFNLSTTYQIDISNIAPLLNSTGSYYVNLKLFDGITEKYSEYFPYFTQSDDDLTTPEDNILEVFTGGLNYPTGIWNDSGIKYKEFGEIGRIDSSTILNYHTTDTLLKTPIKELNITNTPNDLITLILKYYKSYNCYNLDDNIERTFLLNKNLK